MTWQIDNVKALCQPDQPHKFSCLASAHTLSISSIVSGMLGPERMSGSKGIYHANLYGFAARAVFLIPNNLTYTSAYLVGGLTHEVVLYSPCIVYWLPLWCFIKKGLVGSFNLDIPFWTSSKFSQVSHVVHLTIGSAIACILSFFGLSAWSYKRDRWGNSEPGGWLG